MRGSWMKAMAVFMGVAAFSGASPADLGVGGRLEPFALQDQRSQQHRVDESTRLLLFSRDKGLAKMAFHVLDQKGGTYLSDRRACMILDISAMPGVITWAIAKPRMRRHPFPLLLDAGPGPTKNLPTQDKKLTLVYLNRLSVEQIAYVANEAELEKALQGLKP
ncbi:hypothetical protein [Geothrix sp. 21YS21S-4]|uniref:hypothetical protein n=1 Tax=Geothrix sp. 21YS21S-4 TaxID=3068889 RepID=UPI0027B93F41|nr:hypothetical protein [Geothrix sp. 21YS21S-4]